MLNNPNEWHNLEEDGDIGVTSQRGGDEPQPKKSSKGLLVLLFLVLIGASFYFLKNNNISGMVDLPKQNNTNQDVIANDMNDPGMLNDDNAVIDISLDDNGNGVTADNAVAENNEQVAGQPAQENNNLQGEQVAQGPTQGQNEELVVNQMPLNTKTIEKKNETVLVSVGGSGRENPFIPSVTLRGSAVATGSGIRMASMPVNSIPFEIIEPPSGIHIDPMMEEIMGTTISGIMYDSINPSAIINLKGQDQLVRKGDIISGFNIIDITKDKVVIKHGTNIYRASVGQAVGNNGVNVNDVYNLKNRFGGAYSSVAADTIEINAN